MKVTFSTVKDRYQIACTGGVDAYVEGARSALEAHETVVYLAETLKLRDAHGGIDALLAGEVVAAIYGNVVFIRT